MYKCTAEYLGAQLKTFAPVGVATPDYRPVNADGRYASAILVECPVLWGERERTPRVVLNVVTSTYLWRSSIIHVTVLCTALVI